MAQTSPAAQSTPSADLSSSSFSLRSLASPSFLLETSSLHFLCSSSVASFSRISNHRRSSWPRTSLCFKGLIGILALERKAPSFALGFGAMTLWWRFQLSTYSCVTFCPLVGNVVMVTGGRNRVRVGVITNTEEHKGSFETIHVTDALGHEFATRQGNVFIIGQGSKPWVSLPKCRGIKKTIIEEAQKWQEAKEPSIFRFSIVVEANCFRFCSLVKKLLGLLFRFIMSLIFRPGCGACIQTLYVIVMKTWMLSDLCWCNHNLLSLYSALIAAFGFRNHVLIV
ncbi:hypothetical protein Droror1_Dr00006500 [Drosera rotundifolia]